MLQWFYLIIELWLCSSGGNIGATALLLRHWCESLSIPMDHMNSFNSLNHSSRWTRNNDTMWQSSTVTLCYHATHCVTELVCGGYSMYRGWFVQFLHSFYAFSASEKPSVKCFFCLWWKCAVLIVTKNEKETEKIFIQVKTPAGIFVWEVRQEDKIGTSCDRLFPLPDENHVRVSQTVRLRHLSI